MSHMKGIHVSFDIVDEFTPRVPRQRCPGEDETVPRICVAEDILNAVNAVPQAGLVMENMNPGKYGVWTTRLWILQRKRLRIRLDTTLRLL